MNEQLRQGTAVKEKNRKRKKETFPFFSKHSLEQQESDQTENQTTCTDMNRAGRSEKPDQAAADQTNANTGHEGQLSAVGQGYGEQNDQRAGVRHKMLEIGVQKGAKQHSPESGNPSGMNAEIAQIDCQKAVDEKNQPERPGGRQCNTDVGNDTVSFFPSALTSRRY